MLRGIGILLMILVSFWAGAASEWLLRPLDSRSYLDWGESRIAGIASEHMRRTPALAANFEAFRLRAASGSGNFDDLFAERDKIIARTWPEVFDRLMVYDDWGRAWRSDEAYITFRLAVKEHGRDRLQYDCVPRIEYHAWIDSVTYDFKGFVCSDNPPAYTGG